MDIASIKIKMKTNILFIVLLIPLLGFALKSDSKYISHPDSIGIPYETQIVQTTDGASLHVWKLIPPSERKLGKTIILASYQINCI